jgi:pyruvate/2-oxoglutarate dehydrogenase complex dihydrolipoamide dehydrogenase (E3) component
MPEFDLAVIGAGAAGLSVTAVAAQLGLRVVLIERDRMGGDCLNTGCVPSKALLAAARVAHVAGQAVRFGIRPWEPEVDWEGVRRHVAGTVTAIEPTDSIARYRALGAEVVLGEARFVAPDALLVDGRRLTARRIVIAAGARPTVPAITGLGSISYLTNRTLFALDHRPDHLLILGGGPVGLEMAVAHAALGSRVTVIEAASIAPREDPELADGLRRALRAQGIVLIEREAVTSIEAGPTLVLGDNRRIRGTHLLIAVGRTPNVERLDLSAGNIRAGPRGIATDLGLRSVTNRRVYAVGDIADPAGIGPLAFTHVGSYHAAIVVRRALFRLPAQVNNAAVPRVIYTYPELAQVGLTEAGARAMGHKVQVLRASLAESDRAVTDREPEGLVKLVVGGNRVMGAGILASHAGEMIGQWTLAIARRVPLSALIGLIVPYAPRLFSHRAKTLVRALIRLP